MKIKKKEIKERKVIKKMEKIKISIKLEALCQGLPNEFITFIQYARDLKFIL